MNDRISHVFTMLALLFAGLIAMLTWWQVLNAGSLRNRQENRQSAYYEQRVKRGDIMTRNGNVVVTSVGSSSQNGDTIYSRRYRSVLAPHVVGYDTRGKSRTGLERRYNDELTGATAQLSGVLGKITGQDDVEGNSLVLTLRAGAQRTAERQLAGERGSIVALNPNTGAVLVMASAPGFDPNAVEDDFESISGAEGSPLLNRATQARYTPGSIFKLVTAAAALENDVAKPDSSFRGGCQQETAGPPVRNFGGACFGQHDLTTALTNSINTTFAQLGQDIGAAQLRKQMEKFGFGTTPPLDDLPSNERFTSGLYGNDGKLLDDDDNIDAARVAIGQERLQVTPLQMAMVGATIANDGIMMQPFLVERVRRPNGSVADRVDPERVSNDVVDDGRVMSAATANQLTEMMKNVVREGTGVSAAMEGIEVAGKTGTADTGSGNQVWFLAFAPADRPKVAIVVTLESKSEGVTGGGIAAPKARAVMEQLLR